MAFVDSYRVRQLYLIAHDASTRDVRCRKENKWSILMLLENNEWVNIRLERVINHPLAYMAMEMPFHRTPKYAQEIPLGPLHTLDALDLYEDFIQNGLGDYHFQETTLGGYRHWMLYVLGHLVDGCHIDISVDRLRDVHFKMQFLYLRDQVHISTIREGWFVPDPDEALSNASSDDLSVDADHVLEMAHLRL